MAKPRKFDREELAAEIGDEDEKTLAAIDAGIGDAKAGRTIPVEAVRKRLRKWVSPKS